MGECKCNNMGVKKGESCVPSFRSVLSLLPAHDTNCFTSMSHISLMSHVEFKNWPCNPVTFRS